MHARPDRLTVLLRHHANKTISNFIAGFAHPPLDAQFEAQRAAELQNAS